MKGGDAGSTNNATHDNVKILEQRAPCRQLLDPCPRQERSGRTPLGQPTYLDAKAEGDKSMLATWGRSEDVYDPCPARPA